ncbi:MAG: ribonuclease D [Parvularculaceae bacterium]|nr:ribonuclease D [Parvularculaceae bacterium]
MKVITDTAGLQAFVNSAQGAPFITVDTEFMREKTYFSQLCLIQVATPDDAVIIDPLADGIDLAVLYPLLTAPETVKVFHAARQDLEIFVKLMGTVPAPLFDTQIAAMVFGYGDQVGYEPLVRDLTSAQVDKGSRFTDWSRRPLSDKQLTYALGDVTHLRDVYAKLTQKLADSNRLAWVEEEMLALNDINLYSVDPDEAWQRLKLRNPKAKELGPIIALAKWREAEAQSRNVPRSRLLKDDALFELARAQPDKPEALGKLRSIPQGFERSATAKALLAAITDGKAMDKEALPQLDRKPREQAPQDVVELLRVLLKRQCAEHDVAPKLLASSSDLDAIALDDDADVPALRGWRREVFGNMALKLKRGELALSLSRRRVSVHEISS